MKNVVYLGIGSNLGDRLEALKKAKKLLDDHPQIEVQKESSIYETEPWPREEKAGERELESGRQNWHLNQVLQIETHLIPEELLKVIHDIEKKIGKQSKATWGSRIIDIDILLYNKNIIEKKDLKIPHPYIQERRFVLVPLTEIEAHLTDPKTGEGYRKILEDLKDDYLIKPYNAKT